MNKNTKPALFSEFIDLCINAQQEKMLPDLFEFFLTPEERQDIATRLLLVKALLKGDKTQREIAKDSHISIAKITRGSNELKRTDKKFLDYLDAAIK